MYREPKSGAQRRTTQLLPSAEALGECPPKNFPKAIPVVEQVGLQDETVSVLARVEQKVRSYVAAHFWRNHETLLSPLCARA